MHFATFAGSDVEALDPIVELEQAKREMSRGEGEGVQIVGDWWTEGGMGVVDVGETAVVPVRVGETALPAPRGPGTFGGALERHKSGENVRDVDPDTKPRDTKGIRA
jgi:hypothetical protein